MDSLNKIKDDISNAKKIVEDIPDDITVRDFHSAELKKNVTTILNDIEKRVKNIVEIQKNITAIREEIINPVNEVIRKTSKSNLRFTIYGVLVGLFSAVITLMAIYIPPPKNPPTKNQNPTNPIPLKDIKLFIETNGKSIIFKDGMTGNGLNTLESECGKVTCVDRSNDGKFVLFGCEDGTIQLWDIEPNSRTPLNFSGHHKKVLCTKFSLDGSKFVSASADKHMILWKISANADKNTILWRNHDNGNEKGLQGHLDKVLCLAFSYDGKMIVSGGEDKTIKLWDCETGKVLKTFSGHTDSVRSVIFLPDNKTVVSGGNDNLIKIWDVNTGEKLRQIEGHNRAVITVAFSPKNQTFASVSEDKTFKVWDVETCANLKTFHTNNEKFRSLRSLEFTDEGKFIFYTYGK